MLSDAVGGGNGWNDTFKLIEKGNELIHGLMSVLIKVLLLFAGKVANLPQLQQSVIHKIIHSVFILE